MNFLSDENIINFLNKLKSPRINQNIIDKLATISFLNKSAYYWYLRTIPQNIENGDDIVMSMIGNTGNQQLLDYIVYVTQHLEDFLQQLNRNSKLQFINIPLTKNSIELHWPIIYFENYKFDPISSQNIKFYKVLPILENIITKIMKLAYDQLTYIWYPQDYERYPKQRAMLYNALVAYDIKPEFQIGINQDINTYSTNQLAGRIINSVSYTIDVPALSLFSHRILINDSKISLFIQSILQSYFAISKLKIPVQKTKLDKIEALVETKLCSVFNIPPNAMSDTLYATENMLPRNDAICDKIITGKTIFKVLSSYQTLNKLNTNVNIFKPICPIQVKYVMNTFKYYKNQIICIENDNIIMKSIPTAHFIPQVPNKLFMQLTHLVKFNNNYEDFRSIISQITFSDDELEDISTFLFEMTNFKYATIAAEILQYNNNIAINSKGMYSLLSKLSKDQCQRLNSEFESTNKIDLLQILLSNNTPIMNTNISIIQQFINHMLKTTTFNEKINLAAKTQFHIVPLTQLFIKTKDLINQNICIQMLMLYSNAPFAIKNTIFNRFQSTISLDSLYYITEMPNNINIITDSTIPSIYDLYLNNLHYDITNTFPDIVQYIKDTKDITLFSIIRKYYNSLEKNENIV